MRLWIELTKSVTIPIHGKAKLTWFEEIFEEYKHFTEILVSPLGWQMTFPIKNGKIRKNNSRIEEKRCKKKFW
ncbi:chlorohydrolase [Streptococcus oralis subsp. tigurinus]|uniref:Chlorohydrolase n=1 Tax=Streptococcus oralis subsp. tigurinus TaxID=1077464 RepID=A0A1X0WNX1_STROR|nr:chlorohydrolase [Streptococcus oralis subsp. tigurinus]